MQGYIVTLKKSTVCKLINIFLTIRFKNLSSYKLNNISLTSLLWTYVQFILFSSCVRVPVVWYLSLPLIKASTTPFPPLQAILPEAFPIFSDYLKATLSKVCSVLSNASLGYTLCSTIYICLTKWLWFPLAFWIKPKLVPQIVDKIGVAKTCGNITGWHPLLHSHWQTC